MLFRLPAQGRFGGLKCDVTAGVPSGVVRGPAPALARHAGLGRARTRHPPSPAVSARVRPRSGRPSGRPSRCACTRPSGPSSSPSSSSSPTGAAPRTPPPSTHPPAPASSALMVTPEAQCDVMFVGFGSARSAGTSRTRPWAASADTPSRTWSSATSPRRAPDASWLCSPHHGRPAGSPTGAQSPTAPEVPPLLVSPPARPPQAPKGESPGASLLGFLRKFGREFNFRTTGIEIVPGNPSGEVALSAAVREGWPAGSAPGGRGRAPPPSSLMRLHIRDPVTLDSDVGAPCKKIELARVSPSPTPGRPRRATPRAWRAARRPADRRRATRSRRCGATLTTYWKASRSQTSSSWERRERSSGHPPPPGQALRRRWRAGHAFRLVRLLGGLLSTSAAEAPRSALGPSASRSPAGWHC